MALNLTIKMKLLFLIIMKIQKVTLIHLLFLMVYLLF